MAANTSMSNLGEWGRADLSRRGRHCGRDEEMWFNLVEKRFDIAVSGPKRVMKDDLEDA